MKELDVVRLTEPLTVEGEHPTTGDVGVIVHVYTAGGTYEVEFHNPHRVVTLQRHMIEPWANSVRRLP